MGTAKENPDHPTILFEMLRSNLSPEDKEITRLNEEAQLLVAAGLTTAAWAMSVTSFYIIQNPSICERLRHEMLSALPTKDTTITWSSVENLPYLNACIREGLASLTVLRLGHPDCGIKNFNTLAGRSLPAHQSASLFMITTSTRISSTTVGPSGLIVGWMREATYQRV